MLRDRLAASLPGYMVPSAFHWRESLPLTANSKIDKKALTALAAGARRRRRRRPPGAGHADRAAARGRVGEGARRAAGPDRPAGSLLRPGRHVAVGGEAGDHPGPGGVAEGPHPPPGPRRPGRAGRRDRPSAAPGCSRRWRNRTAAAGRRPGVLPLRRRQRGELPGDGQRAAGQRAGGLRRGAARSRPGRRERAVRADRPGGGAGRRRDQPARPDRDPAVGPARRAPRSPWRRPGGCRSAGWTSGGCSSARNCSATPARRRAAVTELAGRSNAEIAAGLAPTAATPSSATWTSGAPSTSAPPTGTTACPRTATSPTPWTSRRAVRLSAPVTVVVAADDPATPDPGRGHRDWQLLATRVDLHELADGGHYFLRTRPADAAQAVLGAAGSWPRPAVTNGKDNEMSSSSPASLLDVDLRPGRPPVLQADGRRRAGLGGRAPGRAARRRRRARLRPGPRARAARCGRGRRRVPAAGHRPDDRAGGVRGPAAATPAACTPRRSGRRTSRCACTTS